MATIAQTFYPDNQDQDQAWGTDIDKLDESVGALVSTTIASHPNSSGTTQITLDPYTTRSTSGDSTSSYGWAFDESGAEGIGSAANNRRFIPAGTWTFQNRVQIPAGGAVTGSHNVTITYKVYRVAASPSFARTLLFTATSSEQGGGLLGSTVTFSTTSASQPEILLEPGETVHVGYLSQDRQVAGLLGATTAGTLTYHTGTEGGVNISVQVPSPGVRTFYERDQAGNGIGTSAQQPKGIAKAATTSTGIGATAISRIWQAYRDAQATGVGSASDTKALTKDTLIADGVGTGLRTLGITKDEIIATGVGTGSRSTQVSKAPAAATGVGTPAVGRTWQAYRSLSADGVGTPAFDRIVTFVRQLDAEGTGTISSFRLCLDADELPSAGGGTTYVYPLNVFDD